MSGYLVNPEYGISRVDRKVYARVARATNKWEPVPVGDFSGVGNVRPVFSTKTKKFCFKKCPDIKSYGAFSQAYRDMYQVISSALLLYRLLCLFPAPVKVEGKDRYKCIWWIALKHKETGEILMFGEWKGAAGIWTKYHDVEELPASYKKDTLALLNQIAAADCPHPYDGCVAGSVA